MVLDAIKDEEIDNNNLIFRSFFGASKTKKYALNLKQQIEDFLETSNIQTEDVHQSSHHDSPEVR